ncbi:MAG: alcohol dehydrogenase catalytic domain-containing protein [Thermoplasmatota archaeon]
MRAAVIQERSGPFVIEERPDPEPAAGQVRIRVHACGYCLSDENIRHGGASAWPRVPGHEAAGVIDALGPDVPDAWRVGDRVGVGWHGGHCNACDTCRSGDVKRCPDRLGCGSSYDGGFATHLVVPHTALARIPDGMDFEVAGPLLCAGITVWNALRRSGASWGDRVAVQGLGGLGHLAVQFADAMGFETVVVTRTPEKSQHAKDLGADHVVDASGLQELGGCRAVIATAPSGDAMRPLFDALGPDGRLMIVGVSGDEVGAPAYAYLGNDRGIQGSVIGSPSETEACLRFAQLKGVTPWVETFSLDDVAKAQEKLLANELRFRAVLTMAKDS